MAARDRVTSRFMLVAVGIPALLTAVSVAAQLAAIPALPDTVAVHWGPDGAADRFGAVWTTPLVTLLVGLGVPALIALTTLPWMRRGGRGPSYRFLGALAAGIATVAAVLGAGTTLLQAGLRSAHDAPAVWAPLVAAFACAIPVGVAAWYLQPAVAAPRAHSEPAAALRLGSGERAVWIAESSVRRGGVVAIGATIGVLAAGAVAAWLIGDRIALSVILTAVALVLAAGAACTLVFRVRADDAGLTVSSIAGFPRFRVPLHEIVSARVTSVEPMGDFGGWGIRLGRDGRFGVALRSGPAIEVERAGGRRFVVTVADAATGAALLQALAERERAAREL